MSLPIQPPNNLGGVTAAHPPQRAANAATASESASLSGVQSDSVSVDTFPSTPPQEVLDQMQAAASTYLVLQGDGVEVHYEYDHTTKTTTPQLRHTTGGLIRILTPAEASAIAAGEHLVGAATHDTAGMGS